MPKPDLKGVIPAIVTPFDRKTEEWNEGQFRNLIQTLIFFIYATIYPLIYCLRKNYNIAGRLFCNFTW